MSVSTCPPRAVRRRSHLRLVPPPPRRRRPATIRELPGLDGLRALAVAAVFVYHAQVGWLPGGLLGVDVFFVLSGYLITSLLLAELDRRGRISLRAFWVRRARRLLPALIAVLVVSLVLAAALHRSRLDATRVDALAALLYVANWHDAFAHVSYFSQFGPPPLLRHLWSLSVEEQFYAVWPPLVVLAARRGGRRAVAGLAAALIVASAIEMLVLSGTASPTRIYEGTDTRAATLLVGALAAVALSPERLAAVCARLAPALVDLLGLVCAGGLAWLMVTERGGATALLRGPLLGASLLAAGLVLSAAAPRGVLGWLLGRPPLTWIGRRSYGIYLWHWPIIALLRPAGAGDEQSPALTLAQAALTVAAATASYALIEQPIRRRALRDCVRALTAGPLWRSATVTVAAVCAVSIAVFAPGDGRAAPQRVASLHGVARPERHGPRAARRGAGAVRRGPTAVFGDSVAIGTSSALAHALGSGTRFNADVGRQPQDTVAAVAAAAAAGGLPDRVVVSLGDNGVVTSAMLRRLRDVTRGVGDLVVVTPRVPDPWGPASAATIRAAASWWPGLRIADWAALSAGHDDWFVDGVHPGPAGTDAYVGLVAATLDRSAR